jgi:Ca2+-binding EF-hand superfamily protein
MTDELRLKLILILCSITAKQDQVRLKEFVQVCSYHVTDTDFNKIMRKALKILDTQKCGSESCPDWLMNNLFDLYKNSSED